MNIKLIRFGLVLFALATSPLVSAAACPSRESLLKDPAYIPVPRMPPAFLHQFRGNKNLENLGSTSIARQALFRMEGLASPETNAMFMQQDADNKAVVDFSPSDAATEVLVGYLHDRLRDELSLWAQDKMVSRLCGADSHARDYFGRTCRAYEVAREAGIVLTIDRPFRRSLRRDLDDAPYCYLQKERPNELAVLAVLANLLAPLKTADQDAAGNKVSDRLVRALSGISLSREDWSVAGKLNTWKALDDMGAIQVLAIVQENLGKAASLQDIKEKADRAAAAYRKVKETDYKKIDDRLQDVDDFLSKSDELLNALTARGGGESENTEEIIRRASQYLALSVGDYSTAISELRSSKACAGALSGACAMMATAALMSSAESEEQMRAILDSYTSPVGAWRTKQAGPDNIASLSARVGVGSSRVSARLPDGDFDEWRYEPVASLGLDYSIPHRLWRGGRIGFQLQMLDLGAAFADPEEETPSGTLRKRTQDRLSSYMAPGIAAYTGIPDTPVIVGVSAARYDDLYLFDDGVNPERAVDTEVYSLFIAVDIMMFPF